MSQHTNTRLMDTSPGGESVNQHVNPISPLPSSLSPTPPTNRQLDTKKPPSTPLPTPSRNPTSAVRLHSPPTPLALPNDLPKRQHQLTPTDTIPPRGAALAAAQKNEREQKEHRDENRRYGEAISEHGFGGETTGITHSITTSNTANTGGGVGGGGSGVGGGGGGGGSSDAAGEQQTHRHGSYETSPEVEEREVRDRRRQGYGEGSGVGG